MAFNIDPNIAAQAGRVQFDPASILMQAQQNAAALERHRYEMQALRDKFDADKEARKQQKAMQMGIASDLEGIKSGTPAQYAPMTYQQTPRQGQMPFGMTGVLASERGQNMPQPQAFGEDLFSGNYQLGGGEVTQEAVAGREPTYSDLLETVAKNSAGSDIQTMFEAAKALNQQRQFEKEQSAPIGNPYPVYDQQGNFVGTRIMTKSGQEMPFGQAGTTTVKPDVLTAKDKAQQAFEQQKLDRQLEMDQKKIDAENQRVLMKPDPVAQALAISTGKETAKEQAALRAQYREKYANASDALPLLDNYIDALKHSPKTGAGRDFESGLGYVGMGSHDQQAAMAQAEQAGEALVTFAQKQPGPSTDRDVMSYRAQMGVLLNKSASSAAKIAAANQAKALILKIQKKYGNYADKLSAGAMQPPDATQINHGDIVDQLPPSAPKGAIAKNLDTGKPEYIFNGVKWIPFGSKK